jgi:ATP-dependent Clp endopeptidase proteolytic subunit ClpP
MRVKNKCIEFKNIADTGVQELYFYGDIVSDECMKMTDSDTCPQDIQDVLNQIDATKPLNIYINSCGGSVFAGISIYNMLKRSPCNKTVYIDGLAGSIASVIAMAGDKIVMPSNSFLMIHKPLCAIQGNATDMVQMASDLDKIQVGIMNIYAQKLAKGCDIATIQDLVNAETWIVGSDASKYFDVTVIESNKAVASVSSLLNYSKVPKELKNDVPPVIPTVMVIQATGCLCPQCTNESCVNCCNCNSDDDSNDDSNDDLTQSSDVVEIKIDNVAEKLNILKLKLELENL